MFFIHQLYELWLTWFTGEVLCTPHIQPRVGHNMDISWSCKGIILAKNVCSSQLKCSFGALVFFQPHARSVSPTSFPPPLSLPCSFLFVLHLVMLSSRSSLGRKKKKEKQHLRWLSTLFVLVTSQTFSPLFYVSLSVVSLCTLRNAKIKKHNFLNVIVVLVVDLLRQWEHFTWDQMEERGSLHQYAARQTDGVAFFFFFFTTNSALCGWDLQPVRHCWWPLKWDPTHLVQQGKVQWRHLLF